ncbi:MAG: hypothetical protein JSU95_17315 [Betaproteobacteria bacterium]|nr:MAG: hypothetical protein JSU95_17315 [Betaproteobacteria bacterium]
MEQNADRILIIYRGKVRGPDPTDKGRAEVIIGNQRNGPISKLMQTFQR